MQSLQQNYTAIADLRENTAGCMLQDLPQCTWGDRRDVLVRSVLTLSWPNASSLPSTNFCSTSCAPLPPGLHCSRQHNSVSCTTIVSSNNCFSISCLPRKHHTKSDFVCFARKNSRGWPSKNCRAYVSQQTTHTLRYTHASSYALQYTHRQCITHNTVYL